MNTIRLSMLLVALPCILFGQSPNKTVTAAIPEQELKSAIASLFAGSDRKYEMDIQVATATIPAMNFDGVSFDIALKSILKSAGLSFEIKEGVYHIITKQALLPQINANAKLAPSGIGQHIPTFSVTQGSLTAPIGVRLTFAGTFSAPKGAYLVSAELRIGNQTVADCNVDKSGGYQLSMITKEPVSRPYRIIAVLSNGSEFIGKRGSINVYDIASENSSPIAISNIQIKDFAKASLQLSGSSVANNISLLMQSDGTQNISKSVAIRTGAVDNNLDTEIDLSDITIANYRVWPMALSPDELVIGPAVTLTIPEYVRVIDPQNNTDWLVADPPVFQEVHLEGKDIENAEVSILADDRVLATGTMTNSQLTIKVNHSKLGTGNHELRAIAKSNGRTVSTLPISLRVSNPGQDAADAQEVAQKQAAIEQKRQQIAA
ncbi:MAG: hypothetical protein NT018_08755, partial [Armatimonadetes bacterium]|nr:hypothetical protein [Armatimonadota bacterium]